ncbi:hypothetical protein [Corynebacterium cystitidis]|uniref:hypothetical protein n=1 Tax=Corynebacterium cystitidis TaxID=35757 RepID=UPI00211EF9E4|nr:hypothetical protein [Corynebacterium cystitidis]
MTAVDTVSSERWFAVQFLGAERLLSTPPIQLIDLTRKRGKMISVKELYEKLDSWLPEGVDRENAESNFQAGEIEYAVTSLLDDAFAVDALSDEIVAFVAKNTDALAISETLDALRGMRLKA